MRFTKRIIGIILSLIMVITMSGISTLTAYASEEVPGIIYIPWKLEPGEIGAVYGEDFDKESTVAIQPLSSFSGELSPESAQYKIVPFNINNQFVQFEMPSNIVYDVYAVWVKNSKGWSKIVYTNKAIPYWVNEHEVYAGQKLMLYVRNAVNPTNRSTQGATLEFVEEGTGTVLKADITDITDFQVFFTAPSEMKVGSKYNIRYTNGAGGDYGWSDMENIEREVVTAVEYDNNSRYFDKNWDLNVSWFSAINTTNVLNVKDFGAKGDGVTNDTKAIQSAVDKAKADGGGVVYIPNGTYIVDFINIGAKTILRGENDSKTVIKWSGNTEMNGKQTPRTTINRNAIAGTSYAEAHKIIYTDESYVGLFDLSIISDLKRPEELYAHDGNTNRMIYGYVVPVAMFGHNQVWGDDNFPEDEEGYEANYYVVKNVNINAADGEGVMIWSEKCILEDCDMYITHGNEIRNTKYIRVRNNRISNILRPLLCFMSNGDFLWLEGNELTGRDDMRKIEEGALERPLWGETYHALEHRGTDLDGDELCLVNNTFLGVIGATDNSGEGFQWQEETIRMYTKLKESGADWLVGNASANNVVPGDKIVITGGRGLGTERTVTDVQGDKIFVEKPWDVTLDNTTIFKVANVSYAHTTFYKNTFNCNNNKGSIHLYRSGYDVAIVDNNLPDGGGIRMAAVHRANTADTQYFNLVENNYIAGSTNIEKLDYGATTVIGPTNDGGTTTTNKEMTNKDMLSVLQYGMRILHNDMTGIGTDINDKIFRKTGPTLSDDRSEGSIWQHTRYGGIVLSTFKKEEKEKGDVPNKNNVAAIIDSNKVTNCLSGIHTSVNTFDAVIRNNDLSGNGVEINVSEGEGNNDIIITTNDGKGIGLFERDEINKSSLRKTLQNNSLLDIGNIGDIYTEDDENTSVFLDIKNHWANSVITFLAQNEIVEGVSEKAFEPDRQVTRAEFITMLIRACGMSIGEFNGGYYDVYTADWYAPYMQVAKDKALLADAMLQYNKAFPNALLLREQAASITARAMQTMGYEEENKINITVYDDFESISEWTKPYISYLYSFGIMKGTDIHTFEPKDVLTRAEAAMIIYNLWTKI